MRKRFISILMMFCMLLSSCTYFTVDRAESTAGSEGKADRVDDDSEISSHEVGDINTTGGYELLSNNFSSMPAYEELKFSTDVAAYSING